MSRFRFALLVILIPLAACLWSCRVVSRSWELPVSADFSFPFEIKIDSLGADSTLADFVDIDLGEILTAAEGDNGLAPPLDGRVEREYLQVSLVPPSREVALDGTLYLTRQKTGDETPCYVLDNFPASVAGGGYAATDIDSRSVRQINDGLADFVLARNQAKSAPSDVYRLRLALTVSAPPDTGSAGNPNVHLKLNLLIKLVLVGWVSSEVRS